MSAENLFPIPPETQPKIYAYSLPKVPDHNGYVKIGYTTRNPRERIREQLQTAGITEYTLHFTVTAQRNDGTTFTDHDVHRLLDGEKFQRMPGAREWFRCSPDDARRAVEAVRKRESGINARDKNFRMRPEQSEAVRVTAEYFSDGDILQKR